MEDLLRLQADQTGQSISLDAPDPGTPELPESGSPGVPESRSAKWREMERKEALLRPDQIAHLGALLRTVKGQRTVRGERLTENTLIRVALDLLFAHEAALTGNSEEELRASVGGARPESA